MKQIVGIFGVPRSGTSWLGQIFNSSPDTKFSYQPMLTDKFCDRIHPRSSAEEVKRFMEEVYLSDDDFLSQKDDMIKSKKICFYKETESPDFFIFKEVMYLYMVSVFLKKLKNIKIIFIIRNPIDVLTSWYNAPKEFYREWDIQKEWRFAQKKNMFLPERYYGYNKWKEAVVLAYEMQKEYTNRIKCICYEDLRENPIDRTKELFEFIGLEFKGQTYNFIVDSQSKTEMDNPYSVYRKKNAREQIKKELPDNIIALIKDDLKEFVPYCGWDFLI